MSNPYGRPPAEGVMEPGAVGEFVVHPRFARLNAEHRQHRQETFT